LFQVFLAKQIRTPRIAESAAVMIAPIDTPSRPPENLLFTYGSSGEGYLPIFKKKESNDKDRDGFGNEVLN